MRDVFDIYTIIFLALAVFIFLRLRSVLGQRTGRERPPYDPYSARDAVRPTTNDNVVALPGRGGDLSQKPSGPAEPAERWKGLAEEGSVAAAGLDAIARDDKSFDAKAFAAGRAVSETFSASNFERSEDGSLCRPMVVSRLRETGGANVVSTSHRELRRFFPTSSTFWHPN